MIERVKLGDNESYETFVKNNEMKFWKLIIRTIEEMSIYDDIDTLIAFTVYGGSLERDKQVIVKRDSVCDIIDTAMPKMELYEEYEICTRLIELRKHFDIQ